MTFNNFTYLFLLLGIVLLPVLLVFFKKLKIDTQLKYLIPAVLITALLYVIWDIRFVSDGIWTINPDFTVGIMFLNIPAEELVLFLVLTLTVGFIYEYLNRKLPNSDKPYVFTGISIVIFAGSGLLAFFNFTRDYTFDNFLYLTFYLGYTVFRSHFREHFYLFYLTYLLSLVPFLIVRGVLVAINALEFASVHILGIKFLWVPLEDYGYFFLLCLLTITIYEHLNERRYY